MLTVLDRCIAPAILPVLGPIFDPDFAARSDGFRPGRSAHQALQHMCHDIEEGDRWVMNIDLENFFARVNHARVRSRGAWQVTDKRLLKLRRPYRNAGITQDRVVSQRETGMPQGSPRSPLLSKVLWDDLDQELERRGHRFCRDADDANVYVRRPRAGERVMTSLRRVLEECLRPKVNRSKGVVHRPGHCTSLGSTVTNHLRPRLKPAPRSVTHPCDGLDHGAVHVNRRVRPRPHSGVGGREGRPSLLPG
jgi:RNA-directed DNA polymerase